MLTSKDIQERLSVTAKQVEMAIYSGYIPTPKPSDDLFGEPRWSARRLEPFLLDWANRINSQSLKEQTFLHAQSLKRPISAVMADT